MTYIADHHNANLTREQVRWQFDNGSVTKIAAWAVPGGVHAELNLPGHIDLYLASTGDWTADLHEAINLAISTEEQLDIDWTVEPDYGDYTDCGEEFLAIHGFDAADTDLDHSDLLNAAILDELSVTVSQLNPDCEYISTDSPAWVIRLHDTRIGYVYGSEGAYTLPQLMFFGQTFATPESAVVALMEMLRPSEVLLALALAQQGILDRQMLPDYI